MRNATARAVGLLLVGALVGYLAGPPIAEAVTSIVTIKGAGSTNRAKVDSSGRLLVAAGGSPSSVLATAC